MAARPRPRMRKRANFVKPKSSSAERDSMAAITSAVVAHSFRVPRPPGCLMLPLPSNTMPGFSVRVRPDHQKNQKFQPRAGWHLLQTQKQGIYILEDDFTIEGGCQ